MRLHQLSIALSRPSTLFYLLACAIAFTMGTGMSILLHRLDPAIGILAVGGVIFLLIMGTLQLLGADVFFGPILVLSLMIPLNLTLASDRLTFYSYDLAIGAVYILWFWEILQGKRSLPQLRRREIPILSMLVWFAISGVWGTDPVTSLDALLFYLRMFLIYFYVANRTDERLALKPLLGSLLLLIAVESSVGFIQYATRTNFGSIPDLVGKSIGVARTIPLEPGSYDGSLFRVRGTLAYDTQLACWYELLLPLALSLALTVSKPRDKIFLLGLFGVGTVGIILTFTRGGWLGLALSVIMIVLLFNRRRILTLRPLVQFVGLVILLGALLLPLWGVISGRLFASVPKTEVVRARLNEVALKMVVDYPIFGLGLDNFASQSLNYGLSQEFAASEAKVHNLFLAVASETGIMGLILFLWVVSNLVQAALEATEHPNPLVAATAIGIVAGTAGILAHGVVAWGLLTYVVYPLFWLLMGTAFALQYEYAKRRVGSPLHE